jgi:multidrug efflux pump subunit AcrA (membrane-fusion protein)
MEPAPADLAVLSDHDLHRLARELKTEIAIRQAQIEAPSAERKATRRILRGTFLTAAGFFGLSLDPLSGVIALVGLWDWVEVLRDDAEAANRQMRLRADRQRLAHRLTALEAEIRRRGDL